VSCRGWEQADRGFCPQQRQQQRQQQDSSMLRMQQQQHTFKLTASPHHTLPRNKPSTTTARKRWVIYGERATNKYNPTTIPAEWHGWINYVNDNPPATVRTKGDVTALGSVRSVAPGPLA